MTPYPSGPNLNTKLLRRARVRVSAALCGLFAVLCWLESPREPALNDRKSVKHFEGPKPQSALDELYSAHPEARLDAVVAQQGAFLVRAAQLEVARIYSDTRDLPRREEILAIVRVAFSSRVPQTEQSLDAWLAFTVDRPMTSAPSRWEPPLRILPQAHRWMRALKQVRVLTGSLDEGVVRVSLLPRWKQRAERICAADSTKSADHFELPIPIQISLAAWRVGARVGLEEQLVGGKSCRQFVSDLLEIVYPHASPMRPAHLEAFSPWLLRVADNDTSLDEGLETLSRVERLNPNLDLVSAVREFLPSWSSRRVLRLLGAASHNHSMELLYLEKVLARTSNEEDATQAGTSSLAQLNHLYRLIDDFYGGRWARPYHFHGAALVACELTARGYPRLITTVTGSMLGEIYERATSSDGELDAGDIRLHEEGTRYGIEACTEDTI